MRILPALLAPACGLLALAAQAAPVTITECIPFRQENGEVTVPAYCNAASVNETLGLRLNPNSPCAANDQEVSVEGRAGRSYRQGTVTRRVEENAPPLRACSTEEVISFTAAP